MINSEKVLQHLRLTEKSNKLSAEYGQYTFEVAPDATKHTVREAVEQTFKVTVTRVNIQNMPGKNKRSRQGHASLTSEYKKAVVTLKQGDKIELV